MVRGRDREVVDQSTAAVVTTEDCANDGISVQCNTAQAGVAQKILLHLPPGIPFRYLDAFGRLPNRKGFTKIVDVEFPCRNC